MNVDEFLSIFTEMQLITQTLTERDILVSFNQAMMTQVDEVSSERHMKMQILEFVEALSRCADIISLPPPGSTEAEWPMSARLEQPLVKKIEHLLFIVLKMCKKEFINKYSWPGRDVWGLFIVSKPGKHMM